MTRDDLAALALECDECTCWLPQCEAECCKVFTFYLTLRSEVLFTNDEVRLHTAVTPDMKRYYELHGAKVEGDWVIVPRDACKTTLDKVEVYMTCRSLRPDNLCALHDGASPRRAAGSPPRRREAANGR